MQISLPNSELHSIDLEVYIRSALVTVYIECILRVVSINAERNKAETTAMLISSLPHSWKNRKSCRHVGQVGRRAKRVVERWWTNNRTAFHRHRLRTNKCSQSRIVNREPSYAYRQMQPTLMSTLWISRSVTRVSVNSRVPLNTWPRATKIMTAITWTRSQSRRSDLPSTDCETLP